MSEYLHANIQWAAVRRLLNPDLERFEGLLNNAFIFDETPEGHEFWAEYCYRGKPRDKAFYVALGRMIATRYSFAGADK